MRRLFAAVPVLAAAFAIWLGVFFGSGYTLVWLIESFEGSMSECWKAGCRPFGEFFDDHERSIVILLAMFAMLPAAAFLWKARTRFVNPS